MDKAEVDIEKSSKFAQEDDRFEFIINNIVSYNNEKLLLDMSEVLQHSQKMLKTFDNNRYQSIQKDTFYENLESLVRACGIAKFQDHDINFNNVTTLVRYSEWQELFEKFVKLIVKLAIKDPLNKIIVRALEYLFDHNSKIYEHFKDSRPKRSIFEENSSNDWRQLLKPGEKVDAVLVCKNGSKQWASAQISKIHNDIIELKFVGAPESYDRCYYRFSPYFCLPDTHSSCYEWKQHLQKMDKVCKIDESGIIKICTVIDRYTAQEKGRKVERVQLRYRTYDSSKWTNQDKKSTFCGKDSSFDEDVPLMSTRITCCLNTGDTSQLQNIDLEIANDIDYCFGPKATNDMVKKYAFAKPGVRLPYLLTYALDCFEEEKGFEKILKIDASKFTELDIFEKHNCIKWTDKFLSLYKPQFFEKFVPQITAAIENNFQLLSEIDPSEVQKSNLLCYIEKLIMILDKVDPEKQEEIKAEPLYLAILSKVFKSQNVNFTKGEWLDCIKYLDPSEHPERKYQSAVYKDCLAKYELLCDIFNPQKQLLSVNKRRKDILIFMLTNNLIKTEGNLKFFDRVLQLMQDVSYNISTDFSQEIRSISKAQKEALFQYFESVEFKPCSILHFHLYCELVQYESSDSESCGNKIECLWDFIVEKNFNLEGFQRWAYSEEKIKWVFTHFVKLLKYRKDLVKSYRSKCIELFKSKNPNANLVCILRHILKMLLKHSEPLDEEEEKQETEKEAAKTTRISDLVDDWIKNENLIELVCNSLSHHIKDPIDYSTSSTGISLTRHMSDEKNAHLMHIRNHLKLLKFIAKYSSFKFTKDKLLDIHDIIMANLQFMEHKKILKQWLEKLTKAQKNGRTIFDGFDVESLMNKLK